MDTQQRRPKAGPWRRLVCRLNLSHHWRMYRTEDGGRYRACMDCGKERGDGTVWIGGQ